MNKTTANTEEELRVISWWNNMDGTTKTTVSKVEFGEKKSYKKLSYNQVRTIYKRWR